VLSRLDPTKSYRSRDLGFLPIRTELSEGVLILNCMRGRKSFETAYDLQCERSESGRLNTVYLAKRADADGAVYGIVFDPISALPARCNCSGFGRWKGCKHVAAVRELTLRGELQSVPSARGNASL